MPRRVYELFFSPIEVVEVRAFGLSGKNPAWEGFCRGASGVICGYFNDPDKFHTAALALDKAQAIGIYFSVNPTDPSLLARAVNRLIASPKATTTDKDIKCLRWLPIDLDPIRPAGISSSNEELKAAEDLAREITSWLEGELGFERGIRACSGNGYHLMYRLPDLPNNDEHKALIRSSLKALALKFPDQKTSIDMSVFNPARVWKLYGTTGRKGDDTAQRPHRKSYLFQKQPETLKDVPVSNLEKLKRLAALAPVDEQPAPLYPQKTARSLDKVKGDLGTLDVGAYLSAFGRQYNVKQHGATTLYRLAECLFDPNHRQYEAAICQSPSPPFLTFQCFHDSCHGRTWKEARAVISGSESLAPYCANYDPEWKAPQEVGSGLLKRISVEPTQSLNIQGALVPPPEQIDPSEFYEKRGKRAAFVPMRMAKYYTAYLGNIVHTDKVFWHYENGLWEPFSEYRLGNICVRALKEQVQPSWIDGTIKILAQLVNREQDEWPEQGNYINCLNGMIGIAAGNLVPHDPKYGSRTQVPCVFDVGAPYDRWGKFLEEIFPGEKEKEDLLQQFFGYCLLNDCRFERCLFMYGGGANGKGVVLHMLRHMVGPKNSSSLSISEFKDPKFSIYFLQNKLINISSETSSRDPIATETFKKMVSGEPVTTETKYNPKFEFVPYVKFISAFNDVPVIPDRSYGFERRVLLLGFSQRFEGKNRDPDLKKKLESERDGVFMWSLLGLEKLLRNNDFVIGERVRKDGEEFMKELNPVLIYIDERLDLGPQHAVSCPVVYKDYKTWCEEGGHRRLSRNRFYAQLLLNLPTVEKKIYGPKRCFHFVGMDIKIDAEV